MEGAAGQAIRPDVRRLSDEIRRKLEGEGYVLTDAEYESLLLYSDRKRRINGKGPDYLPLLMEDEIRQKCFRDAINAVSEWTLALA